MQLDATTRELWRLLLLPGTRDALSPVIAELEETLAAQPGVPQAWKSLALDRLPVKLPEEIQSCWVFVLRAGATFGAERHPNSHQRSVALSGNADFELFEGGGWKAHPIGRDRADSAISIPPMAWHRIQIGPANFVSASFHTCPSDQLIEETPVADDLSVTKQRAYHT